MKKIPILTSFLAAAILSLITSTAMAYPINHDVYINCPHIKGLSNFGNYIGGYGSETLQSQNYPIYFRSGSIFFSVNLKNYSNSGTEYDPAQETVSCQYSSSEPQESGFSVIYQITNGKGGWVQSQSEDTIYITIPLGLKG